MEQLLVSYAEPLKEFAGPKRSMKNGADWLHTTRLALLQGFCQMGQSREKANRAW